MTPQEEINLLKTEIKSLREEVRSEKELCQLIIDNIPTFVFWKDRNSVYQGANNNFKKAGGLSDNENILGKTDYDLSWKTEESDFFVETDQRVMGAGNPEYNIIEPQLNSDGSETWLETTKIPLKDSNGEIKGILGLFHDITESKNSENKIDQLVTELKEKNHTLQATMNDLIRTQSMMIHSEKMATLGQLIAGISHEINTPLGSIKASIETMASSIFKAINQIPLFKKSMSSDEIMIFHSAINTVFETPLKRLSSRESRHLKNEIRATLENKKIANSNELTNLIIEFHHSSNLHHLMPLLIREDNLAIFTTITNLARQKILSDVVKEAVNRSSRIVKALHTYVYKDNFEERSEMDVVENIDNVLVLYQNQIKNRVKIIKEYPAEDFTIFCSSDEINQVWVNLIHNALDAIPEQQNGTIKIKVEENINDIMVTITDSGTGIPDKIVKDIFKPYFTTKSKGKGTGLGLDIVKKIVDKHNGKISLQTELGVGTSFFVKLPKL